MTAYISNYEKRKRILLKREAELLRAIRSDHPEPELLGAADGVRDARLRMYKAEWSMKNPGLPPSDFVVSGEALEWREHTPESIVALFRERDSDDS